jgi:hypothetical protein
MAIDPNIALGIKPIQIDSPLNSLTQIYQVKAAQQAGDLGQMKMDEYQQGVKQKNALRDYFASNDQSSPDFVTGLAKIDPAYMQTFQKNQSDLQKSQGDVAKQRVDLVDAKLKQRQAALVGVNTPEQYLAWHAANHADPILGPQLDSQGVTLDSARASINEALKTPDGFKQLLQQSALGVAKYAEMNKPQITNQDLGGTTRMLSTPGMGGVPTVINTAQKTQTADSAANTAISRERLAFDKSKEDGSQDSVMDPIAVRMAAQQYLAGDDGALKNFGRGAQGAKNLNAVRLEITKQATDAGLNGADVAAKIAEFQGMKAGQRTTGTRTANIEIAANEAAQLAPLALDASVKVARSGLLPFGKLQIMFDSNTNDPNLRQFSMANNALVNAYGQVMSRGGVATVSDKEHARELLATSFDQPSYAAAVQQLQAEIKAAQAAPGMARKDISRAVSGRTEETSPISKPAAIPSGWSVKER